MKHSSRKILKITSVLFLTFIIILTGFAYFYYLDLKKVFVAKLSERTTAFIGQKVYIENLSFSPSAGINLYNISIQNPEGFEPGNLLKMKRLFLKIIFRDLLSGRFHFQRITVYSPELTLIKDKDGRLNISDKLMNVFKRKTTVKYKVDEFGVDSGIVDYNNNKKYRNENINLNLQNLSSDSSAKTLIKGDSHFMGAGITIDGWAFLKDEPKRFGMSLVSGDFPLFNFRDFLESYKIDAKKIKIRMNLALEGDSAKGLDLISSFQIKNVTFDFINKEIKNLSMNLHAFFDIHDDSILVTDLSLYSPDMFSLNAKGLVRNVRTTPVYDAGLKINMDLSALKFPKDCSLSGSLTTETMRINGNFKKDFPKVTGRVLLKGFTAKKGRKNIVKDASLDSKIMSDGKDAAFTMNMNTGKLSFKTGGTVKGITKKERLIRVNMELPDVKLTDIRDAFWDIFPDRLLYAGLDGSISSNIAVEYRKIGLKADGKLVLRNVVLSGENSEYSAGPVNGVVPIAYRSYTRTQEMIFPSFERSQFDNLIKSYSGKIAEEEYSRLTVASLSYGFKFIENLNIWLKQEGTVLNIGRFSGKIFGGMIIGAALVDIFDMPNYRAGFILNGLSLTKLCDGVDPIKGYISGKVNGIGSFKGTGKNISHLIGMADFWTYATGDEKTKISGEFLRKLGGPTLKTYLGDRSFDKGVVGLYLKDGYVTFRELEISHKNFLGMTDLSVKVAPLSNRIAIDHLMWTITEAAQRAQER